MGDTQTANVPTPPDPAAEAQATALIRLLEANGCVLHGEWYPEPGAARLKYTRRSENHAQMWVIDVRPWAGWNPPRRRPAPAAAVQAAAERAVAELRKAIPNLAHVYGDEWVRKTAFDVAVAVLESAAEDSP